MRKSKTKPNDDALVAKPVEALDETEAVVELERLAAEIAHHDELYYRKDAPEISDAEYDALVRELRELEARHPELITPDSPTQRVSGQPIEAFGVVEHRVPLLSLGNAFSEEELRAWFKRVTNLAERDDIALVCEPKIDGLAVALEYEGGRFAVGSTRWCRTPGSSTCRPSKTSPRTRGTTSSPFS